MSPGPRRGCRRQPVAMLQPAAPVTAAAPARLPGSRRRWIPRTPGATHLRFETIPFCDPDVCSQESSSVPAEGMIVHIKGVHDHPSVVFTRIRVEHACRLGRHRTLTLGPSGLLRGVRCRRGLPQHGARISCRLHCRCRGIGRGRRRRCCGSPRCGRRFTDRRCGAFRCLLRRCIAAACRLAGSAAHVPRQLRAGCKIREGWSQDLQHQQQLPQSRSING